MVALCLWRDRAGGHRQPVPAAAQDKQQRGEREQGRRVSLWGEGQPSGPRGPLPLEGQAWSSAPQLPPPSCLRAAGRQRHLLWGAAGDSGRIWPRWVHLQGESSPPGPGCELLLSGSHGSGAGGSFLALHPSPPAAEGSYLRRQDPGSLSAFLPARSLLAQPCCPSEGA